MTMVVEVNDNTKYILHIKVEKGKQVNYSVTFTTFDGAGIS